MSAVIMESRRPGMKGRRIPGRPGRFDPSLPMHMTTRKRAKGGPEPQSPSVNGSTEDEQSRRGSLDGIRPTTSHSLLSQASPETPPSGTGPGSATSLGNFFHPPQILPDNGEINDGQGSPSSVQPEQTPTLKRKRVSGSPPSTPNAAPVPAIRLEHDEQSVELQYTDEEDEVELVDPNQLSDREVTDPDSESDEQPNGEIAVAAASFDNTPAASNDVSPASSVSDASDTAHQKPREDAIDIAMPDVELDATRDAGDVDDEDEDGYMEEQAPLIADGRPIRKFGGKRRRAVHPDPKVEVALRRQLETKKAFRNIARELKGVLAEIAQRTLDDLTTNPNSSAEAAEYRDVQAGLEAAFTQRKALIRAQHKLDLDLLKQRLQDEQQVRKTACRVVLENAQDTGVDRLQHDILVFARAARLYQREGGYETQDEDDVVPRPKRAAYRFKRGDALEPVYESRSLLALETERSVDDLQRRLMMRKMLGDLSGGDKGRDASPFTVMDSTTRDMTVARREEVATTDFLAAAAREAERIANIPMVRNEDAVGLQLLGDLCTRPSITAQAREMIRPASMSSTVVQQTPPRPGPPQMMSTPSHPDIAVEMSPRASQVLRERYEGTMPPPQTPRQAEATFGSPFAVPHSEHIRPSPIMQQERPHGLPLIAAKLPEGDGMPRFGQSPITRPTDRPGMDEPMSPGLYRRFEPHPSPRPLIPDIERLIAPSGSPRRRAGSMDERPRFDFMRRTPLLPECPNTTIHSPAMDQQRRPDFPQSLPHWTELQNPSAFDKPRSPPSMEFPGFRPAIPPITGRPMPAYESLGPPRSRNSSMSFKEEQRSEGSQVDEKPPYPHLRFQDANQSKYNHKKLNKAERGGESRRKHGKRNKPFEHQKENRQQSVGGATAGSPPQHASGPFTPNIGNNGTGPRLWDVPPPQLSALSTFPHPAMPPPNCPPYHGPFRPQGSPPIHEHGPPHHQHRNSFPPGISPPASWHPQPSPLYAVPQPPQPPPPGVDQYQGHHGYAPPPPPPQMHHQPPMTPQPMSAPGSYGLQFGGPAIAPATPDLRFHPPGFRPGPHNPGPAFAQQRLDQPHRRRTNSEAHIKASNWRSYEPGPRR